VPRFRLLPTVELFPAAGGDVYLLRPGKPEIVVRSPSPADRALLERLAREPVPGTERIAALVEAGVVIPWRDPVADARQAERFSRQLPYLAEIAGAEAQQRLARARVAILGCGGLGTWILAALAAAGVGRFVLVDDDTVELSNLNRQVLYGERDVGRPKVEAAAAWVRGFDSAIEVAAEQRRVNGPEDAPVDDVSLLVLAADWPPYELGRWVNRACVGSGVPFVTAGQQPPLLKAGPTYIPGVTACFACHEAWLTEQAPIYPELAEHRRRHPSEALTLGPASALVGGLVATDALHLLAGAGPPATAGTAILVDMRTLAVQRETIARRPDCPMCGR
jgi:bacteriocin biosynthesis cyclodehydratase domain-containing protein